MSVAILSNKELHYPLSQLGEKICDILLSPRETLPTIICETTGRLIEGQSDWNKSKLYSSQSIGRFYLAYGYAYVLCIDLINSSQYVSVYRCGETYLDHELLGRVYSVKDGITKGSTILA